METKEMLKKIREDNDLTQDQMAEKLLVTRQAVPLGNGRDTA